MGKVPMGREMGSEEEDGMGPPSRGPWRPRRGRWDSRLQYDPMGSGEGKGRGRTMPL
jgi:hypothetical protein